MHTSLLLTGGARDPTDQPSEPGSEQSVPAACNQADGMPANSDSKSLEDTSPVCTPPPKPLYLPDTSTEKKYRHRIYKSKNCGHFCWDCKRRSGDIQWLNSQTCLPEEFKSPPGDEEEVHTPRKGEAETLQDQVKVSLERAQKRAWLRELQEEEARLHRLIARRAALQVTSACSLVEVEK